MNILKNFFNSFNRGKIILLIAFLALSIGAILPWYCLPTEALAIFRTNLYLTNIGKAIAALFAIVSFSFLFQLDHSKVHRLFLWNGLIAVLLFPYFITTWFPAVDFIAISYYNQEEQVREHVESHFPDVQAYWKQNIYLQEPNSPTSTFDFSITDSRFFQISSLDKFLIEGLGYNNSFFGFIGRGWAFTVVGFTFGIFALYLEVKSDNLNAFLIDMGKFLPWVGVSFLILVVSLVLPNTINYELNTMLAKGNYHEVVAMSRTIASLYPPLRGDEAFLHRWAEAGFYGNEPDMSLINFAKGIELYRQRDFIKAANYFQQSLNLQPKQFLVRGYLATTILNQGVTYFNDPHNPASHKPGAAVDCFEQVLHIFPNHIQALYYLMLARVINGEFEKSTAVAKRIIETQKYSQQPILGLLGQAYLHSSWASFQNSDMTQAWKQYRQSIDSSTREQSDEAKK